MENIPILEGISPDEVAQMWVCFGVREESFRADTVIYDISEGRGELGLLTAGSAVIQCIDYRPSTGVAELCGLTEPTVTLMVTYRAIAGETELTLRVGAQRDGGYYATVNDDDTIYLLPAAPAEALAALAANGLNG